MAGAVAAATLLATAVIILAARLRGAIRSQSDLVAALPSKIPVLGTIPPIASDADQWRRRRTTLQVAAVSALACIALAVFLIKVRPIL
jgi:hypothetical protein